MSTQTVLRAHGVAKTYSEGDLRTRSCVIISFALERGKTLAIVGTSGSGKSTLLRSWWTRQRKRRRRQVEGLALSALSDHARGEMRNHSLGFIYQFHHLLPEFTAIENVAMPLLIRGTPIGEATQRAARNCSGAWV